MTDRVRNSEATILEDLRRGGLIHIRREYQGRAVIGLEKSIKSVMTFPRSYEDEHDISIESVKALRARGFLRTIINSPHTEVVGLN